METQDVAPAVAAPLAAEADKTIALGSVGKIEIDFTAGVAKVAISAAVPGEVGLKGGAFIECDAEMLVTALAKAIEVKLPDSADPIAETVKNILIMALKAIK